MMPRDQLAEYLDGALDQAACAAVELELERDAEALRYVVEQRRLDRVLRSLMAPEACRQRLKESIVAAIAGPTSAALRTQVLADTSGRSAQPAKASSHPTGWINAIRSWCGDAVRQWPPTQMARLAAAAVVILLAAGAWLFFQPVMDERILIGELAAVAGQPSLQPGAGRTPVPGRVSTPIHLGDRLETGDADRAEVRFRDGTTLRLGFNTTVEIRSQKSEVRSQKSPPGRPSEVHLIRGQVWTKVQKTTNALEYAIRTDAATAVARGTEFGVRLQRPSAADPKSEIRNPKSGVPLLAVLTVKEGAVDFFNAYGSVQATAMTESTARTDSAPTEPKRLSRLVAARHESPGPWTIVTAPLSMAEAPQRLVGGGGWAGFQARDVPSANAPGGSSVRISHVAASSPAADAGLMAGDIVLAIDGHLLQTARNLVELILFRADETLAIRIRRGDDEIDLTLTPVRRSGAVSGPSLGGAEQATLADLTRKLTLPPGGPNRAMSAPARDERLQAAAENNRGVLMEIRDELGPAIRAYAQAVRAQPDVALYRYNVGMALRKVGSLERATEELEAAVRLAPASSPARSAKAEILALQGRDDEALALADAALADDPTWHGLWELKAQVLAKQRRYAEALAAAQSAVDLDPDCVVALSYLGGILRNLQRYPEAAAALSKALEIAPFQASLEADLGDIFLAAGQLAPAEAQYRRALELNPGFALANRGLGDVLADRGELAEAEKAYLRAIESYPDDPESRSNLADLYREQLREPAKAAENYRRALELAPDHVEAHSGLALLAAMRGEFIEAERLLRRAAELDPKSAGVRGNLAEVLRHQDRLDEAIVEFHRAIELDPDNTPNLNNLAILHANRREFAEAERLLRAVLERRSKTDRISPLLNLAQVSLELRRAAEAEAFLREALALQPENPTTCNQLALLLGKRGIHLDEALALARRSVASQPENPVYLDTLGWVLLQRGELDTARAMLKSALERASDRQVAEEIRKDLQAVEEKDRDR